MGFLVTSRKKRVVSPFSDRNSDRKTKEFVLMGMKNDARNGYAVGNWPLGAVLVGYRRGRLATVLLGDDETDVLCQLQARFSDIREAGPVDDVFCVIEALSSGDGQAFEDAPLEMSGTEFQKAVWEAIREIPLGQTSTYARIASRIGRPKAVRAVATACGANPIAILVPCQRGVRGDGNVRVCLGYRTESYAAGVGGTWRSSPTLRKAASGI
ncbi:methylated-DNA--[protein]-cysteine S-methyltransferase [Pararhizobium sp. BT-229]|uniref:methylated-DNA--[protein]-cysteine S-methyltransferase n=1 Tax=Pararhizobium sp. BT-229 TaxID=2986923 RepID=UPI0021F791C1|nr:methylated-DNA--[protein]-cysteine S-methyltransferase [Pararhizobium sp. BT-229]MCV9964306.1 methylated-DNA--[protein]-cysteine S-methyltransferase [Pararhizobium sp. BT-229]